MAFVPFVSAVWRKQVWNKVLPLAVSEHSNCQIFKHQVQLCPPTCLTCRDPCQAGPEFTQMLIHTDPESTGITSHMWWNGGNCFLLLHYTHPKGWLLWICWGIYDCIYKPQDQSLICVFFCNEEAWYCFGKLTVLMGLSFNNFSLILFSDLYILYTNLVTKSHLSVCFN